MPMVALWQPALSLSRNIARSPHPEAFARERRRCLPIPSGARRECLRGSQKSWRHAHRWSASISSPSWTTWKKINPAMGWYANFGPTHWGLTNQFVGILWDSMGFFRNNLGVKNSFVLKNQGIFQILWQFECNKYCGIYIYIYCILRYIECYT